MATIEWLSTQENDMVADQIALLLFQFSQSEFSVRAPVASLERMEEVQERKLSALKVIQL
jgi:hypothetical protein